MALCTVPECTKPHKSNGLCNGHDARLRRGVPLDGPLVPKGNCGPKRSWTNYTCMQRDCDRQARVKGLCDSHYFARRWRFAMLSLVASAGGECHRCGGQFPPAVYDFHHKDPNTKVDSIHNLVGSGGLAGFDKAVEEAKKCELLCANCHRAHHTKWRRVASEVVQ